MATLKDLNNDLLRYTDQSLNKHFKSGIIDEWYSYNFLHLANAIKKDNGRKIIIDVDNFSHLEHYYKKLFLLTDTLIIRDTTKRDPNNLEYNFIPITDLSYSNNVDYENLPPVLIPPPTYNAYATSSTEKLNNTNIPIAFKPYSFFSSELYDWMLGSGRDCFETGAIAFAPFIPDFKTECMFLSKGFNISKSFNAEALYSKNYNFLDTNSTKSLFHINLPTIENIDIETLSKIKYDNEDSYKLFSDNITLSLQELSKYQYGSNEWMSEIHYINKHCINDNLNKLNIDIKNLKKIRALRKLDIAFGVLDVIINAVFFNTLSIKDIGLVIEHKIEDLKEKNLLEKNPYTFLWKVNNIIEK